MGDVSVLSRLFRAVLPHTIASRPAAGTSRGAAVGSIDTVEIEPPEPGGLRISYAPERDAEADAGEIVWTWVPFAERDGRGKDRPVLVIGTQSADRVYAMKLTSQAGAGDDALAIGTGPWDAKGRPSWLDTGRLYSVHRRGLRREGAALDSVRFAVVADALRDRYGWRRA